VVLQLITLAGDFVTDDIWYRVVQIVTNNEDLQDYAAAACFRFLDTTAHVHENGLKVGAYILGEFSEQLTDKTLTGERILAVLHAKFPTASTATRAMLLTAYTKMANTYPGLKGQVGAILDGHRSSVDAETQQRACEYFVLNNNAHAALMESVLDVMPNYSERESLLLKRIHKGNRAVTDRDVWGDKDPARIKEIEAEEKKKAEKKAAAAAAGEDDDDSSDSDDVTGSSLCCEARSSSD